MYDHREGSCRDDLTHLYHVRYAALRPALLSGADVLVMLGLGLIVLGRRHK